MSPLRARCTDAAPEIWTGLLASDPAATPAHRPELWRAMIAVNPGLELRFLEIEEDAAPVGGAPVLIERRGGFTWLRAMPYLLSGAPITASASRAAVDDAAGLAMAELQRSVRASGGEWALYRAEGEGAAASALDPIDGETRWFESAVIDLGAGLEAALGRVDRKSRQGLAQSRDAGLRFDETPDAVDLAAALNARQARRWSGRAEIPIALSRRLLSDGVARLFAVRDGRGPLCAALALDGGRETMLWWSGAREEARASGAYAFLVWSVAEWAHARGRLRLNLGASTGLDPVASFKRSLGARLVRWPVRWMGARHAPPAGRLAAALKRRLGRGRPRGEAA